MIFPIFGAFIVGGLGCGVALSMQYVFNLVRHHPRPRWSASFELGWLLFLVGFGLACLAQFTPQKYESWQNQWGFGSMGIGLGCWWIALFMYIAGPKNWRGERT